MAKSKIKIVVATDFSVDSKAGMRFAIQLADQQNAELTFLHIQQFLRAPSWSESNYEYYAGEDKKMLRKELRRFAKEVVDYMGGTLKDYKLVVQPNLDVATGIADYALKNKPSYICCSTTGKSIVKKILGNNVSKLIKTSSIPVICVPRSYRVKPLTNVLYASDMAHYEDELKEVIKFAKPLNANIEMLHFTVNNEISVDNVLMTKKVRDTVKYKIKFRTRPLNINITLLENLNKIIKTQKTSVLVLFSHRRQSFLEKILLPDHARKYSFNPKIPFLNFNR